MATRSVVLTFGSLLLATACDGPVEEPAIDTDTDQSTGGADDVDPSSDDDDGTDDGTDGGGDEASTDDGDTDGGSDSTGAEPSDDDSTGGSDGDGSTGDSTGDASGSTDESGTDDGPGPGVCGDGNVDFGEDCDDANADNTDACLNDCVAASCGDGFVHQGFEACDDGVNDGTYGGCNSDCASLAAYCGDGTPNGGELCDDGNASNNDACLNSCEPAICGDGYVHVGQEECDDGDASNTDACLNSCVQATCGDGFIWAGTEVCDDQNLDNDDGCNNACSDPGALLWTRTYNGADDLNDFGVDVITDSEDNIIVIGDESFQSGIVTWWEHIWIRKYDSAGNTHWSATMAGDATAYDIATDPDDNVIALGTVWLPPGQSNLRIRKYDPDGGTSWTITELSGLPRALAVDGNGNIYVGGRLEASAWLRKYDGDGAMLWEETFDGTFDATDEINDVATDASGNVIVVGRTAVGLDDYSAWVRKYDPNGGVLWSATMASPEEYDAATEVAVDSTGSVYVVADVDDEHRLQKYSSGGAALWTFTQSSPTIRGLAVDPSDNVLVSEVAWGGLSQESNFSVTKYDSTGAELWETELESTNDNESRGLTTDSQGFAILTGYTETQFDGHNVWTGKFAP